MANRILIVSQTFPPAEGIGGRRWAKFAKYLKREGCEIEVIAAKLPAAENKAWLADVDGIKQYHYSHKYPQILSKVPSSLYQKLSYRIALTRARLKADGTPYDRAIFDEDAFLEVLESRLNAFKPQTLIVTSPPVNLVFYAAKIRRQYPDVKFIADFRDPWLDGDYYGYANLHPKALDAEKAKEKFVVGEFDKIVSPWQLVIDGFIKRYPTKHAKMQLLSHGWDEEDMPISEKQKIDLGLIYGGNLYKGFEPLLAFLFKFSADRNVKVEIYSNSEVPDRLLRTEGNLKIDNAIPVQDFFKRMMQSRYLLMLIPAGAKDGFPTKILEFAATGKPIIAVGYAGALSELIVQKGIGSFVAIDRLEQDFDKALKSLSKLNPDQKWIKDHELDRITQSFVGIMKEINPGAIAVE